MEPLWRNAVAAAVSFEAWVLVISGLLLLMGLCTAFIKRLPLTGTMLYLVIGAGLGPLGWHVIHADPHEQVALFLRVSEITVIISLFTVGLKLRVPLEKQRWLPAVILAFVSMTATVGLITAVGVWGLHLPLGAAILLGAILAPTDPVLASELQLQHASDRAELRAALTGEGGLNDGTAFPFVMLGLGLLGLHDLGEGGWRWWAIDVVWAIVGGLGIGAAMGYGIGCLIRYFRSRDREGAALDEYLLLGLIGLSYSTAVWAHAYGFLAVFAAGAAVRALRPRATRGGPPVEGSVVRGESEKKPAEARMADAMLSINEQFERILEIGVVLLVGAALFSVGFVPAAAWFVPLLFFVLRPLAVLPVALTRLLDAKQVAGIAWFGIRGIGSIYYLMYALDRGLPEEHALPLASLTFTVVTASIIVHGISVTPVLSRLLKTPR